MDILREFYFGRILPYEQPHPNSKEYEEAIEESIRLEKQLSEELDGKSARLFNEFTNVECKVDSEGLIASFSYGFRIGVQLMAAAMKDETE